MAGSGGCAASAVGSLLEREAAEIPQLAARQFERLRAELPPIVARLDALAPTLFATLARGSSDNAAALTAYAAAMRMRLPFASLPPSLASVYGTTLRLEHACVLAISQSGESPDLNLALAHAQSGGALTLGLINRPGSALASAAELVLEIGAGQELATAATKSFLLSATAGLHLVAAWSRDAALLAALRMLPQRLLQQPATAQQEAIDALAHAHDAFVVGRGPTLPIAQELALKLKEVSGLHAEAVSAAELLHGPVSISAPERPAIVLAGDRRSRTSVDEAIARLAEAGAPVLVLSCAHGLRRLSAGHAPSTVDDTLEPLAALYAAYPFIAALGRMRGRDPDRPPHLAKVTRTL
jgi:glucosamine--fructose-6-phosphate aminotransferase (isomerizing)